MTTISSDRRTTTTQIDSQGDGYFNEIQTSVLDPGWQHDVDGFELCRQRHDVEDKTVTSTSANGLSITTQSGTRPGGRHVRRQTEHRRHGPQRRWQQNRDGQRLECRWLAEKQDCHRPPSANGLSITTQQDTVGAGTFDQTRTDVTVINADGSRTETVTDLSANGSLQHETVTTISASGLTVTTTTFIDRIRRPSGPRSIRPVLNADGSKTETVTDRSANGSLLDQAIVTTSARPPYDQRVTTTAMMFNHAETDVVNANGSKVTTVSDFNADGTLKDRTVTTTNADGLSTTTQQDTHGAARSIRPASSCHCAEWRWQPHRNGHRSECERLAAG